MPPKKKDVTPSVVDIKEKAWQEESDDAWLGCSHVRLKNIYFRESFDSTSEDFISRVNELIGNLTTDHLSVLISQPVVVTCDDFNGTEKEAFDKQRTNPDLKLYLLKGEAIVEACRRIKIDKKTTPKALFNTITLLKSKLPAFVYGSIGVEVQTYLANKISLEKMENLSFSEKVQRARALFFNLRCQSTEKDQKFRTAFRHYCNVPADQEPSIFYLAFLKDPDLFKLFIKSADKKRNGKDSWTYFRLVYQYEDDLKGLRSFLEELIEAREDPKTKRKGKYFTKLARDSAMVRNVRNLGSQLFKQRKYSTETIEELSNDFSTAAILRSFDSKIILTLRCVSDYIVLCLQRNRCDLTTFVSLTVVGSASLLYFVPVNELLSFAPAERPAAVVYFFDARKSFCEKSEISLVGFQELVDKFDTKMHLTLHAVCVLTDLYYPDFDVDSFNSADCTVIRFVCNVPLASSDNSPEIPNTCLICHLFCFGTFKDHIKLKSEMSDSNSIEFDSQLKMWTFLIQNLTAPRDCVVFYMCPLYNNIDGVCSAALQSRTGVVFFDEKAWINNVFLKCVRFIKNIKKKEKPQNNSAEGEGLSNAIKNVTANTINENRKRLLESTTESSPKKRCDSLPLEVDCLADTSEKSVAEKTFVEKTAVVTDDDLASATRSSVCVVDNDDQISSLTESGVDDLPSNVIIECFSDNF